MCMCMFGEGGSGGGRTDGLAGERAERHEVDGVVKCEVGRLVEQNLERDGPVERGDPFVVKVRERPEQDESDKRRA
eukprot:3482903-Pleurochrysis_carterae.AAC.1